MTFMNDNLTSNKDHKDEIKVTKKGGMGVGVGVKLPSTLSLH